MKTTSSNLTSITNKIQEPEQLIGSSESTTSLAQDESTLKDLFIALARISKSQQSLAKAKSLLLEDLSKALNEGQLEKYRSPDTESTYKYNDTSFVRVTRRKKIYSQAVKKQLDDKLKSIQADIDLIEYQATRNEEFEIQESSYWQVRQ